MKKLLFDFDQKYYFSILLAFAFALPFNTLTSVNSILMALLFLLWTFKIYNSKGTVLFRTPLDIPLLGFFVWTGLSLLWTADFHESFNSWIALGKQIFLFYLTATTVKTKDQFAKILIAFLAAILIIDFYAIIDFFYRGGSLLNRHVRAGSFGSLDYNLLTALIVIFLPLGFIYGKKTISKQLKTVLYSFSFVSLFTLYLGYTRAGWITIMVQLLIFGWFYSRRFFIITLSGILGLSMIVFLTLPLIKQYNVHVDEPKKQIYADDTVNPVTFDLRLKVWKFGFDEILRHPIIGHGYGKGIFSITFKNTDIVKVTSHLHNTFLETVFEVGIPGLILLLVIFWNIFKQSFINLNSSNDSLLTLYGCFMIIMVIGFIFKSVFDHMFVGNISEIFWVLSGLLFIIPEDEKIENY
ncbi:MAG: O-antigen ligase family protein [Nitrospiria bacterium]